MSEDYQVRLYKKNDEKDIVALLDQVFDGWPKFDLKCSPIEHWRWKYLEFEKRNPVAVCLRDDEIVACDHEQLRYIKIGDKIQLCSNGADSAVHPDHRRKGLFTKMNILKDEILSTYKTCMSYAVTSNPILIESSKRRGTPSFPGTIKHLLLIQDVEQYFKKAEITGNHFIKKQGYRFLRKYNKILYATQKERSNGFDLKEIKNFDSKIDNFWCKINPHYNFMTNRNQEYLNWRYCDLRGGDYRVCQVENNGEILGYNVLRINRKDPQNYLGYILDQVTIPGRYDVMEALTSDALGFFEESDVNSVSVWIVGKHPCEVVFKGFGFVDVRSNPYMYYKIFNKGEPIRKYLESRPEKLFFKMGDCDWV